MTGGLDNNFILEVHVKVEMKDEYENGSVSYPGSNPRRAELGEGWEVGKHVDCEGPG